MDVGTNTRSATLHADHDQPSLVSSTPVDSRLNAKNTDELEKNEWNEEGLIEYDSDTERIRRLEEDNEPPEGWEDLTDQQREDINFPSYD